MTTIWVPKRDLLIVEPPNMPKIGYAGFYKLDVLNPDKTLKRSTGWFRNLITDLGQDILGQQVNYNNTVAVGSGNATPVVTDTALQTIVAATSTQFSQSEFVQASAPYFGSAQRSWQFGQGVAAGNLSEVGVGTSSTSLLSRALILDGMGSPTTITVLANEFLNVTYTLQMVVPTSDVTGSVMLDGVSYNYTIRASRAATNSAFYGWQLQNVITSNVINPGPALLGTCARVTNGTINAAVTGNPSGTSVQNGSGSSTTYVPGTYSQNSQYTWAINDGNVAGGITAMEIQFGQYTAIGSGGIVGGRGSFQIGFSAPIPKDNTKQLTLNWNLAWARI